MKEKIELLYWVDINGKKQESNDDSKFVLIKEEGVYFINSNDELSYFLPHHQILSVKFALNII